MAVGISNHWVIFLNNISNSSILILSGKIFFPLKKDKFLSSLLIFKASRTFVDALGGHSVMQHVPLYSSSYNVKFPQG